MFGSNKPYGFQLCVRKKKNIHTHKQSLTRRFVTDE